MMQGLAFEDPQLADGITTLAFDNGLVIETSGGSDEVIKLLVPLTIEAETLLAGLDILEQALADKVSELQHTNTTTEEVTA
jgi:diaminobutyrate-2-oxoglutarate transaminase